VAEHDRVVASYSLVAAVGRRSAQVRMRARLVLVVVTALLLGGSFDDPPSWARSDGGPIDPDLFQRKRNDLRKQGGRVYGPRRLVDRDLSPIACGTLATFP